MGAFVSTCKREAFEKMDVHGRMHVFVDEGVKAVKLQCY